MRRLKVQVRSEGTNLTTRGKKTMRALTLYNDNLNAGVSVLAEFGSKGDWESVEAALEDAVGDIKKFDALEAAIKTFPSMFKNIQFLEAKIVKEVRGGKGVTEENLPAENVFQVQTMGYVVNNPNEIPIEFAPA
jgi:hypothetical protein